jgi:Flp pilus assembly pilin Flp
MLNKFMSDESGVIISAELVLVLTVAVLAMIVGLSEVAVAVNTELNDISNAIGALDQSYSYTHFSSSKTGGGVSTVKNSYAGSKFVDATDDCDTNTTCDLVCGAPLLTTGG